MQSCGPPPGWWNSLELLSTDRRLCYFSAAACWWLTNGFKTLYLCQHQFQTAAPLLSEINGPFGSAAGGPGVFSWEWFPESTSWSCSISLVRFRLSVCFGSLMMSQSPRCSLSAGCCQRKLHTWFCVKRRFLLQTSRLAAGAAKIMWCIPFLSATLAVWC